MPILTDIIAHIGNLAGKTPQRPDDFWDRINGRPLYHRQIRNQDLDLASRRRMVEDATAQNIGSDLRLHEAAELTPLNIEMADLQSRYALRNMMTVEMFKQRLLESGWSLEMIKQRFGTDEAIRQRLEIEKGLTGELQKRGQDAAATGIGTIEPTAAALQRAARGTQVATAADKQADLTSSNQFLQVPAYTDLMNALTGGATAEYANKGVHQDPLNFTQAGRDAQASRNALRSSLSSENLQGAQARGLNLAAEGTAIRNQYIPQEIQTELDLMRARADADRSSAERNRSLITLDPAESELKKAQSEYFRAGTTNRGLGVPIGGDSVMMLDPVTGEIVFRNPLYEALMPELFGRKKLPPRGPIAPQVTLDPTAAPTGADAGGAGKVDRERLLEILRGIRGETNR